MAIRLVSSHWVKGEVAQVGHFEPNSTATPAMDAESARLVDDAVRTQPLLYALGPDRFSQRLATESGWVTCTVPFFYRVVRPRAFFLNAPSLRRSLARRVLFDFIAVSGIGHLIMWLWQGRLPKSAMTAGVEVTPVDEFGPWVDDIWHAAKPRLSLAAVRNREHLDHLFPAGELSFLKLRLTRDDKTLGWFVCLGKQWKNHPRFGRMRIATIVDGLTLPGEEEVCLGAVISFLGGQEIDMITTNQSHFAYGEGMTASGMRSGPSDLTLALSPELARRLEPLDETSARFHFNLGDGVDSLFK